MRHEAGHWEEGGSVANSDADLVRRLKEGDLAAYGRLVTRYQGLVHSIARARLRHREVAEDLTQEVFLKAYLCLDQLADPSRFGAWVSALARNLALDWLRRGAVRSKFLQMVPMEEGATEVADPQHAEVVEAQQARLDREAVDRVLWSMSADLREVILLHYEEDMSQAEIARHLGVHPSTVGRRLEQALAALRQGVGREVLDHASLKGVRARIDGERVEADLRHSLREVTQSDERDKRMAPRLVVARAMALAVAVAALPEAGRAALVESARESVRLVASSAGSAVTGTAPTSWLSSLAKTIGISSEAGITGTLVKTGVLMGSVATVGVAAFALIVSPADPMEAFRSHYGGMNWGGSFSMNIPDPVNPSGQEFWTGDSGSFELPPNRSFILRPRRAVHHVTEVVFMRQGEGREQFLVGMRDQSKQLTQFYGGFLGPTVESKRIPVAVDTVYGLFFMVDFSGPTAKVEWTFHFDPKMVEEANALRASYERGEISIRDMRQRVVDLARAYGYFDGFSESDRPLMEWAFRIRLGDQAPAPNLPINVGPDLRTVVPADDVPVVQ